jgi:hypothetical protein
MSKSKNPWSHGALNEQIVEAEDMRLPVVADIYKMVREILTNLDLIEAEDARRIAAREASVKLHKDISNEQQ